MCEPQRKNPAAVLAVAVAVAVAAVVAVPGMAVLGGVLAAVSVAEVLAAAVVVALVWVRVRPVRPARRVAPARQEPAPAITAGQKAIEGRVVVPAAVAGREKIEVTRWDGKRSGGW